METLYVGFGGKKFRVHRPFERMPPGTELARISWVATDSADRVYALLRYDATVHDGPAPAVAVFDRDGTWLGSWGDGLLKDGHGIAITRDDKVLLVDRDAHQVVACDRDGRTLFTLGTRDEPYAPFNHPTNAADGPDGALYVADGYGNTQVHKFSADGRHLKSWGSPGRGPGQFMTPHGICVTPDNRVLVGDRDNSRIQIFDPDGGHLGEITAFYKPMSFCQAPDGAIYVSDQIPRLTAVSAAGEYVGACRPVLNGAHGVCVDSRGDVYLAESRPNRITKLVLLQ